MGEKLRVSMLGPYPINSANIWGGVQAAYAYLVKWLLRHNDLDIHTLHSDHRFRWRSVKLSKQT